MSDDAFISDVDLEFKGMYVDFQKSQARANAMYVFDTEWYTQDIPLYDDEPKDWTCAYCKGKKPDSMYKCDGCGAPKV